MHSTKTTEEILELVTRDADEVLGLEKIRCLVADGRVPCVYWGTATTGRPHIGYFVPLLKLRDMRDAGFRLKILFADVHAQLDGVSDVRGGSEDRRQEILRAESVTRKRTQYYTTVVRTMCAVLGIDAAETEFVVGSSFQTRSDYVADVYRLATATTVASAKRASAEVVKKSNNALLGGILYPGMQALDEVYMEADIQLGGLDQRKIFAYAIDHLPKIGYSARAHVMTAMLPSLRSRDAGDTEKMSSTVAAGKLDFADSEQEIAEKVKKAYFAEGKTDCGLMSLLRIVVFPVLRVAKHIEFAVETAEASKTYKTYRELEADVCSAAVHPMDVKNAAAAVISAIMKPVRDAIYADSDLLRESYSQKE